MLSSRCISVFLLQAILAGCLVSAQTSQGLWACGSCDKSKCTTPPVECPYGLQLDNCDCCYVCARKEGQRCDAKKGYHGGHGVCGDDLVCKLRDDLPSNEVPEALCYCESQESVCGNDGRNYASICKLNEERYRNRNSGLTLSSRGLCPTRPIIISYPEDVRNYTNSNIVLICEATGNPVPQIEWEVTKTGKDTIRLPSDDQHTAVQSRGGPRQYEVTSWLQLRKIVPDDEGVYSCVALNSWGQTTASAKVKVIDNYNPEQEYNMNHV